jgi:Spy/CpxP family protein refolding chaperone
MRAILLILMAMSLFFAASPTAAEDQPAQTRQPSAPGYQPGTDDMGPGTMGPGSGYHGRGSGMMRYGGGWGHGMHGRGHMMGPDSQGWKDMDPEQQKQWRQMRAEFMQDTLPLRQELNAKLLEVETLWEQQNPDPDKVKALSKRITELRSKLDQRHDDFLTQCRRKFGDRGWSCPGGGWRSY